jgi:hypothetical protein
VKFPSAAVVDERTQRPQPGFVASPARDGAAIDRLPGLPLAGGLHSPRITFRAQACVVPRQAARRDDPPDHWFGRAGQLLVIDLEEAIRRQHAPPMLNEPLVAAEIRNQFGPSGRKRQAWLEMSLMDRERRVDCGAAAMDNRCSRECHVDQPGPQEVERHLVGHARRLRRDRAQHTEIVCRRLGEERPLVPGQAGAVPRRPALVPEMQFVTGPDLGMHGDDLLDESCAGPRHADDQHRLRIATAEFGRPRDPFGCAAGN